MIGRALYRDSTSGNGWLLPVVGRFRQLYGCFFFLNLWSRGCSGFVGCSLFFSRLLAQQGKENDVADRVGARHQHRETVDSDAFATGRRHSIRESADVIFVHLVRFVVAAFAFPDLLLKSTALFF